MKLYSQKDLREYLYEIHFSGKGSRKIIKKTLPPFDAEKITEEELCAKDAEKIFNYIEKYASKDKYIKFDLMLGRFILEHESFDDII